MVLSRARISYLLKAILLTFSMIPSRVFFSHSRRRPVFAVSEYPTSRTAELTFPSQLPVWWATNVRYR